MTLWGYTLKFQTVGSFTKQLTCIQNMDSNREQIEEGHQ
jgi:hypothetical protein